MKGTVIGIDPESGRPCITINDAQRACFDDHYVANKKQFMTKTNAPSWISDPTTTPPASNKEFVQPVAGEAIRRAEIGIPAWR